MSINGANGIPSNQYNPVGYQNVIGMFTVPDLANIKPITSTPNDVMFWAGFGKSQYLIQAGVHAENFNSGYFNYLPFYELYSTDTNNHYWHSREVDITNFPVNPNDYISVGITLQSNGTTAAIRINDQTTGQMVNQFPPTIGCVDNSIVM